MNEVNVSWSALAALTSAIFMIGGALATVLVYINREFFSVRADVTRDLTAVKADMTALRIEIAHDYVKVNDLNQVEARLENALTKIGDRLDRSIDNLMTLLRNDTTSGRTKGD